MARDARDDLAQVLAGDDPLATALRALRQAVDATGAPAPGRELASLLAGGLGAIDPQPAVTAAPRPGRRRRAIVATGAGLALLAGGGVAGALPDDAQDAFDRVAEVVGVDRRPSAPLPPQLERAPVPIPGSEGLPDVAERRSSEAPASLPAFPGPWDHVPAPSPVPAAPERLPDLPPPAGDEAEDRRPEQAPVPPAPPGSDDRPATPAPEPAPATPERPADDQDRPEDPGAAEPPESGPADERPDAPEPAEQPPAARSAPADTGTATT